MTIDHYSAAFHAKFPNRQKSGDLIIGPCLERIAGQTSRPRRPFSPSLHVRSGSRERQRRRNPDRGGLDCVLTGIFVCVLAMRLMDRCRSFVPVFRVHGHNCMTPRDQGTRCMERTCRTSSFECGNCRKLASLVLLLWAAWYKWLTKKAELLY